MLNTNVPMICKRCVPYPRSASLNIILNMFYNSELRKCQEDIPHTIKNKHHKKKEQDGATNAYTLYLSLQVIAIHFIII